MNLLDSLYIRMQLCMLRAKASVKNFFTSEDGVSNVVATIIILLIVVLLIGVFWNRLKEWVSALMDQIFGSSFDESGLGG